MSGSLQSNNRKTIIDDSVQYAFSNSILHGNVYDNKVYYTNMPNSLLPVPVCSGELVVDDIFEKSSLKGVCMRDPCFILNCSINYAST